MPNYQKGKIYKIESKKAKLVYYGSTCTTLKKRLKSHLEAIKKKKKCTSRLVLEHSDYKIELLENYPSKNKLKLETRESYYITHFKCVNKNIPSTTIEDFSKGKIYKLISPSHPELVYYGSTIVTLNKRFTK